MAEGLLRALAPERFEVASAGLEAGGLRPEAVRVMSEIGIDISRQRSKSVDDLAGRPFDTVVTTCDEARGACPLFPRAARTFHWSLPDPGRGRRPRGRPPGGVPPHPRRLAGTDPGGARRRAAP